MSTSVHPAKELAGVDFTTEEQVHLIPKLPGKTTDEIKIPTIQVFENAYTNFTDSNARQYLEDVQPWLYFRRFHNQPNCSIQILDHTGKPYTEVTNWTLQDINAFPANAKKLHEIQSLKQKHPISVPTDTSKTSKTDKPMTSQTTKSTTKSQPIPIAQAIATAVPKDTGASGSPPPSPPTPHRNNTLTSSPDSSPRQNAFIKRQNCILSTSYI